MSWCLVWGSGRIRGGIGVKGGDVDCLLGSRKNLVESQNLLVNVVLQPQILDSWVWKVDNSSSSTIKSAYYLLQIQTHSSTNVADVSAFRRLWRCYVPSKIMVFS